MFNFPIDNQNLSIAALLLSVSIGLLLIRIAHRKKPIVMNDPLIGILDLLPTDKDSIVAQDAEWIRTCFRRVIMLKNSTEHCDIMFLYCQLSWNGEVSQQVKPLHKMILNSSAELIIIASENRREEYLRVISFLKNNKRRSVIMTLDRCGGSFADYWLRLFKIMRLGLPMPKAWVKTAALFNRSEKSNSPSMVFILGDNVITFA